MGNIRFWFRDFLFLSVFISLCIIAVFWLAVPARPFMKNYFIIVSETGTEFPVANFRLLGTSGCVVGDFEKPLFKRVFCGDWIIIPYE